MQVKVKPHPAFPAIYQVTLADEGTRLATKNFAPGRKVYGERLVTHKGVEYRLWDPFRSKLAAAIHNGLKKFPIEPSNEVLYLGAASGTTASHVSDILGMKGYVYCVDFAPRTVRELINNVCAFRSNMAPILEDARSPEKYAMFIKGKVDVVYCDIAQPEQAKILADNADQFLRRSGWTVLAVKAQSIDVTEKPSKIYKRETKVLQKRGFNIEETLSLEPYDKAHSMIVANAD